MYGEREREYVYIGCALHYCVMPHCNDTPWHGTNSHHIIDYVMMRFGEMCMALIRHMACGVWYVVRHERHVVKCNACYVWYLTWRVTCEARHLCGLHPIRITMIAYTIFVSKGWMIHTYVWKVYRKSVKAYQYVTSILRYVAALQ